MDKEIEGQTKAKKRKFRYYCRKIHNHLSFFFAGVILIYAVSGITMNHLKDFNPQYTIVAEEYSLEGSFPRSTNSYSKTELVKLLEKTGDEGNYIKHYSPNSSSIKVFLKEGASVSIDTQSGILRYEGLKKRPVFSQLAFLHYNPNVWWTAFSDIFAVSLIVITLTGFFITKGKGGLSGTGLIKIIAGILIPVIILLAFS